MVVQSVIGLSCDHHEHVAEGMRPWGMDYGFRRGQEALLRKKACEQGWSSIRLPGAPWRILDHCPEHRVDPPPRPDDVVEVRT